MRTTPQLYTLKYIKVQLKDYVETANAFTAGIPKPFERLGKCPRGFQDSCTQCPNVRLWTNPSNTYFECLEMNNDEIKIVALPVSPSDAAPMAINMIIVAHYREIILLDMEATLQILDGESLEDLTKGITYSELNNYIPHLTQLLHSKLINDLNTEQIYLEESKG